MQIDEYPILVEQLCPGLFIRIDEPGVSHSFPAKGFKLKNDADVARVAALGLSHVLCLPEKSDRLPISLEEIDGMAGKRQKGPWSTARTPVSAELSSLKRETIERNKDRLERFAADYAMAKGSAPAEIPEAASRCTMRARTAAESSPTPCGVGGCTSRRAPTGGAAVGAPGWRQSIRAGKPGRRCIKPPRRTPARVRDGPESAPNTPVRRNRSGPPSMA